MFILIYLTCEFQRTCDRSDGGPGIGGGRPGIGGGIAEGKLAPDFKLKTVDGKREVTLSSFAGKKPVALIFGSYT